MSFRPPSIGVFVIAICLGVVTANVLFATPNVVGGGEAKMVASLFFMVVWKALIEFGLNRWRKRRERKSSPRES